MSARTMKLHHLFHTATLLSILTLPLRAADAPPATGASTVTVKPKVEPKLPQPTEANVPYGTHERQVLDFYKAKSTRPTPLLFFIHGGGCVGRTRRGASFLQAGAGGILCGLVWSLQIGGAKRGKTGHRT